MAQSNLWKRGTAVTADVNVTDDDARDLGDVDVKSMPDTIDFDLVNDSSRQVGNVQVTNEVETQLAAALTANATDSVRITAPDPLDVSASTVTVTDDGALGINSLPEPLDVSGATLTVTDDGNLALSAPVGVEDSTGTQVDPFDQSDVAPITASDSGTGSTNAAALSLGDFRKDVDFYVDTSGSATLTVEVSEDGGTTWRQFATVSYSSATTEVEQFDTAFDDIRAYLDTNRNTVVGISRGV